MKITISSYAGFCFGVDRALKLLDDNVIQNSKKPISMLGQLVHNEQVISELRKKGVKMVNSLEEVKEGTLIIAAHGIDPAIIKKAKEKNIYVIDTTCPMVIKAQQIAKILQKEGHQVVIFGDKGHIEVRGIAGAAGGKPMIISKFSEAKKFPWSKCTKIGIISQTTQNIEDFAKLVQMAQGSCQNVKVFNTICDSTRRRQEDIKDLAKNNDAVIIVGSKISANAGRLYEVAKKINKKSYFISSSTDLKKEWFKNIKKVGISAGASTPMWIVKKVAEKISQINHESSHK